MPTPRQHFTPENPPRYGDLFDLLSEALPIVEEDDPSPYKPGYHANLVRRIRSAIESATV